MTDLKPNAILAALPTDAVQPVGGVDREAVASIVDGGLIKWGKTHQIEFPTGNPLPETYASIAEASDALVKLRTDAILALYATAPTAGSDSELEADMERDLTESDHEAIERGLRTIRAFDAVRNLRSVLSDTMARQHNGYDWNADPDGMTLRQSEAVAWADRVHAPTAGSGWVMVPRDDNSRSYSDSLLPREMIDAGCEVQDRVHEDNLNYVAGETTDWDQGMVAVAIYRAMITAAPTVGGE